MKRNKSTAKLILFAISGMVLAAWAILAFSTFTLTLISFFEK